MGLMKHFRELGEQARKIGTDPNSPGLDTGVGMGEKSHEQMRGS